jgi:hypothetical protein
MRPRRSLGARNAISKPGTKRPYSHPTVLTREIITTRCCSIGAKKELGAISPGDVKSEHPVAEVREANKRVAAAC